MAQRPGFDIGVWRSLVARAAWDRECGGSNPSTPTILKTVQQYSLDRLLTERSQVRVLLAPPYGAIAQMDRALYKTVLY